MALPYAILPLFSKKQQKYIRNKMTYIELIRLQQMALPHAILSQKGKKWGGGLGNKNS